MTEPRVPALGAVLGGRYRLEQRVGRGGMADVFRARDELLHRVVAIKLFRPETGEDHDRLRFDAEMRTVAGLRNPGLVTLFDAGAGDASTDDAPYLVMEFVDGRTLRERLADGPLPGADVARLGAELAGALSYVHGRGIVHRDVKPANILLDTSSGPGSARLTDFGIAQLADGAHLTAHGTTVGTANYLSPEQALGQPLGPASDVYSLGLVLLEMLTGRLAYPGSGIDAAIARLHRPPDIPSTLGPAWIGLLAAMTARDPLQRPDAAGVGSLLGTVDTQASPPTATTAVLPAPAFPAPTGPPGSTQLLPAGPTAAAGGRRRGLLVLLAAVVAAAVVLGVVLATSGGGSGGGGTPPSTPVAEPAYPAVGGTVGQDLRALEARVGATSAANTALRADTLALARTLATGPNAAAATLLAAVQADLGADTLTGGQRAGLQAALTTLRADVAAAQASTAAVAAASNAAASSAAASRAAASRAAASRAAARAASSAAARTTRPAAPGPPASAQGPAGGPPGKAKKSDKGKPGKP